MQQETWETDCKENFLRLSASKSAQLSAVSPRFCNHNTKPFVAVNGLHLPGTMNSDKGRDDLRKCIACCHWCFNKSSFDHFTKTLKAIVYYLFILKHSFQCSSSCFCLFLVWLWFLSALSETYLLTFLRESCKVELSQNSCNCEHEIFEKILNWKHDKKLILL